MPAWRLPAQSTQTNRIAPRAWPHFQRAHNGTSMRTVCCTTHARIYKMLSTPKPADGAAQHYGNLPKSELFP
eukprot:4225082-Pyramimonas_sp.AAC.1